LADEARISQEQKRRLLRGPGRPSKLTWELLDRLAAFIHQGDFLAVACRRAGIAQQTFRNWRARGRDARSGIWRALCEAIEYAEACAESAAVRDLRRAGEKDWHSYACFLSHRWPERWADKKVDALAAATAEDRMVGAAELDDWSDEEDVDKQITAILEQLELRSRSHPGPDAQD
jgi:hypothetical protein